MNLRNENPPLSFSLAATERQGADPRTAGASVSLPPADPPCQAEPQWSGHRASSPPLTEALQGGSEPAIGVLAEAPPLGLVSLASSGTPSDIPVQDGVQRRLRKMKRGVLYSARCMQDELTSGGVRFRAALVTLTYRDGIAWSPRHVAELVRHYRQWCGRRRVPFRYVWVLETTKRGVPHYHMVMWLPRGLTPPLPDRQGWWRHGCTNAKWARSPVGYIAKYASKGTASELPKRAHLWGNGGLSAASRVRFVWMMAPEWVKRFCLEGEVLKKLAHGWWRNSTTGYECRSPWEFDLMRGVFRWRGWTSFDVEYLPAT